MNYDELALKLHEEYKGKISTSLRDKGELDRDKLSAYYSPGVGAVSKAIYENPNLLPKYTWTNNLVAVISDGSAVLGLGDVGPKAAMPVMEGKALLFKHFAGIDSVPIVLDVHDSEEIIKTVKAIASSFGAINLEDISAPKCFEIESRLKKELDIPVFHDDQHGTAIVVLAGLINAMKVVNKDLKTAKIVVIGAGAAGTAIIKLLNLYGNSSILAVDSKGIISDSRDDLNQEKQNLKAYIKTDVSGTLEDAITDADIFIGVSKAGLLTKEMVGKMAKDPVIFALANPVPEIMPDLAKEAGAKVVATGRSDFPNQVNNALVFPGIFRGALDNKVKKITDQHKLDVANVLASLVDNPSYDQVIPSVFDDRVVKAIASVIKETAHQRFDGQRENEVVQFVFRRHIIAMRKGFYMILFPFGLGSVPVLLDPMTDNVWLLFLPFICLSVGLLLFSYQFMNWYFTIYIVTNERIRRIVQHGFFGRDVFDIDLDKIQNISYSIPGFFGEVFHFGTIIIQTLTGDLIINLADKPAKIYNQLQDLVRESRLSEKVEDEIE